MHAADNVVDRPETPLLVRQHLHVDSVILLPNIHKVERSQRVELSTAFSVLRRCKLLHLLPAPLEPLPQAPVSVRRPWDAQLLPHGGLPPRCVLEDPNVPLAEPPSAASSPSTRTRATRHERRPAASPHKKRVLPLSKTLRFAAATICLPPPQNAALRRRHSLRRLAAEKWRLATIALVLYF